MKLKIVSLLFLTLTLALLILGITQPMISIKLSYIIDSSFKNFSGDIFNTSRSILDTSQNLIENNRYFVGIMILSFSCLVPLLKTLMILSLHSKKLSNNSVKKLLSLISKWSMADVFVVAIFLVFLATDGVNELKNESLSVMGMSLQISVKAIMQSELLNGFYYFTAYCLLSMIHTQFMKKIAY